MNYKSPKKSLQLSSNSNNTLSQLVTRVNIKKKFKAK